MTEEFNLSKEIGHDFEGEFVKGNQCYYNYLQIENVKEFIKRLKEEILFPLLKSWGIDEEVSQSVITQIDKLAGKKLI